MTSSQLLSIATFVFALAAFFYLAALIFAKPKLTLPARWIVVAAVGVTSAGIILRWVESYQMGIVMHRCPICMNPWFFSPGPPG
jgi:Kef-type K+ transport system membrane component KefB